jgi:putative endonuclease
VKQACIYILANKSRGTLYIGVTSDLTARIWQHKNDLVAGFTEKYQVHMLVYYEMHETMLDAIQREKQLKKWNREWKIRLIEEFNATWTDLYAQITG